MRTITITLLIAAAGILLGQPVVGLANQDQPLLDQIGVTRGICVVLGDAGCERALQLARQSELLIYLQLPHAEDVQAASGEGACGGQADVTEADDAEFLEVHFFSVEIWNYKLGIRK